MSCKVRIPDVNDFVNCGQKIFRAGYCEKHWYSHLIELADRIRDIEKQKDEVTKELLDFVAQQ